ncbi:MFS transporter [Paraburkholderia agricolaris]|uniref:MFS transporter n=1 Tax=Paraburkholderia agricolaris TaxID=2152888 RepID=UPI0012922397|nr:MFS transporter [Paraburkholderia agricolaris]
MSSTSNSSRGISLMRLGGYGAGGSANALAATPVPMLLLYFLTEYVHLEPWLAGMVLAAPKLWDVLVDMPIGRYSDQLALRAGGRLRVCIMSGLALMVLLPLTFFHPAIASKPLLAGFYVLVQILQATCYTVFGVTFLALAGDLATDSLQRNKFLTVGNLGAALTTIALVVCVPVLIRFGGGGERGYLTMTLVVVAAMAFMYTWFYSAVRNAPVHPAALSESSAEMSLRDGIVAVLRNKAFLALIIVIIALGTAGGCLNSLIAYENQYLLGRRPEDLFLLAGPVLVGGLLGLPLAVPVLRRLGDNGTLRIGFLVTVAAFIGYWAGLASGLIPVVMVAGAIYGIICSVAGVALTAAVLDTVKSAKGGPSLGLYLGMFMSAQKLGMSLGGVVSGGLLSLIGYHAGAPATVELHHRIALLGLVGPLVPLLIACFAIWMFGVYSEPRLTGKHPVDSCAETL